MATRRPNSLMTNRYNNGALNTNRSKASRRMFVARSVTPIRTTAEWVKISTTPTITTVLAMMEMDPAHRRIRVFSPLPVGDLSHLPPMYYSTADEVRRNHRQAYRSASRIHRFGSVQVAGRPGAGGPATSD